jgi:hypothetical protein
LHSAVRNERPETNSAVSVTVETVRLGTALAFSGNSRPQTGALHPNGNRSDRFSVTKSTVF